MMVKLEKLFEPARIGKVELKNRIVMAPMIANYATNKGEVTERIKNYYEERAKGGVGLITVAGGNVDTKTKAYPLQLGIYADRLIPGLKELTKVIHAYGAKVSIQMAHSAGRAPLKIDEAQPVRPSYVAQEWPTELTTNEIENVIEDYTRGTIRAKEAGFDLIEIGCAHGGLLEQFLLPQTNKRTDEYGGDLEGRTRIICELIRRIKEKVAKHFPIICRISGNGIVHPIEDAKNIARILERAGVDGLHVTESPSRQMVSIPPMAIPRGCFAPLAEGIKEVINIPVICVGRINDPLVAEEILQGRKADFVALGRALLADPELPNKAAKGELDEIRRCVACNQGCFDRLEAGLAITCAQNASVGKEKEYEIKVTKTPKKVMVVGGGPGGMEAARVAALRGHNVTLYEKDSELGGLLILAAKPPHKDEIRNEINYLKHQVEKINIKVELQKEVTPELIKEINPDVVIIGTGAIPIVLKIPGVDRKSIYTANDVLTGKAETGENITVVGGGFIGCETAEFLAEKGKRVTIVEMLERMGTGIGSIYRLFLMDRLRGYGVKMLTKTKIMEITERGIIVEAEGEDKTIEADTIVYAVGMEPNKDLFKKLEGKIPELYAIGDCVEPRKSFEAIHEGSEIAHKI